MSHPNVRTVSDISRKFVEICETLSTYPNGHRHLVEIDCSYGPHTVALLNAYWVGLFEAVGNMT